MPNLAEGLHFYECSNWGKLFIIIINQGHSRSNNGQELRKYKVSWLPSTSYKQRLPTFLLALPYPHHVSTLRRVNADWSEWQGRHLGLYNHNPSRPELYPLVLPNEQLTDFPLAIPPSSMRSNDDMCSGVSMEKQDGETCRGASFGGVMVIWTGIYSAGRQTDARCPLK